MAIRAMILLIIPLGIIAGMIILQVHLSKFESKWPGLILPIISFGLSVLAILGLMLYSVVGYEFGPTQVRTYSLYEVEIGQAETDLLLPSTEVGTMAEVSYSQPSTGSAVMALSLFYFLVLNIPTVVLLLIYGICRDKRKRLLALNKMSVQDLG